MNETQLMTLNDAAEALSTTRRHINSMIGCGRFGPEILKIGIRAIRIRVSEFNEWVDAGMPSQEDWKLRRQNAA